LRDNWRTARARGIRVFGVNPQSSASHTKFREKYTFPFPLLVDAGQKVAERYHASGLIVKRTVYGIDADGIIRFARRGMPAPQEVFSAIPAKS
jgi:thioredoxin-dependent peroxiredoxin